jgi:hypothetical protein
MSVIKIISNERLTTTIDKFEINLKEIYLKKFDEYEKKTNLEIESEKERGVWKNEEYKINTKRYRTLTKINFSNLKINEIIVTKNIFEFIKLIELLKLFNNSKLFEGEKYYINKNVFGEFNKDNNPLLIINYFNEKLYLKRFKCAYLATTFNKILQKIEVF